MTFDKVKRAVEKTADYAAEKARQGAAYVYEKGSEKARQGMVAVGDTLKGTLWPIRGELESESIEKHPPHTTRRAICYAAKIYNAATDTPTPESKRDPMGLKKIDDHLRGVSPAEGVTGSELLMTAKRTYQYRNLSDTQLGLAIIRVNGKRKKGTWRQLFVVFRGSRGGSQGKENEAGAGWTTGGQNVDWTANLDDEQVPFPGAATSVMVHRGFFSIYQSLRETIVIHLKQLRCDEIIVTGHSLGGGLATLCAYDLSRKLPSKTVVYLSFNAPRAGNEAFARDFNGRLADQTYTSVTDDGGFRKSFRFDQWSDPVTTGMLHSSKVNSAAGQKVDPGDVLVAAFDSTARSRLKDVVKDRVATTLVNRGQGLFAGAVAMTKTGDWEKPFFHVKHRKTISIGGVHSFLYMLDEIVGSGTRGAIGVHA